MDKQNQAVNRAIRMARGVSVTVNAAGASEGSRALMAQLRRAAGVAVVTTRQTEQAAALPQALPNTNAGNGTGRTPPPRPRDINYYIRKAFER